MFPPRPEKVVKEASYNHSVFMVSIEKLPRIFQYPGSLLSKMTPERIRIEAAERRQVSARSHEGVVGASCPCRTIHGMTRTPVQTSQVAQPLRGVLRRLPAKACLAASFGLLVVGLAI